MKIQATISGYANKPCTVYAYFDKESGVLVVSKEVDFRADRFSDCVIISNTELPERESFFTPDRFNEGINSFFQMVSEDKIDIQDAASRCNPKNQIESDGINEMGKRVFRLANDITNGQIAVIAIAWYVSQALTIEKVLNFQDKLLELSAGSIYSI